MAYKNVVKPTSLFCIYEPIDTLPLGGGLMLKNLKGELALMDSLGVKPNYAALGRKYGMDWRTVKKYHNGYAGKPLSRNKASKLDEYKDEISDKLTIKRLSVKGVFEFMVNKYGIDRIGTYSNFNRYVNKNKLKPKVNDGGHPRYERGPGEQAQVDWKEDISVANKYGEIFVINVLHMTLKFSRYSHLEFSILKRFDDVARGLTNGFIKFGGVPNEILFDNMSTVANVNSKPKKPTDAIRKLAKDFGFRIRFCGTRKPMTKGTVEAKNKPIDWIRAYEGEFETLEELVEIIKDINEQMNIEINQETNMSPMALFYKEKEHLQPLPAQSFIDEYLTPNKYKVTDEALIRYGGCKYSVDPKLIGEEVSVDILENKLHIYYKGKLVTIHSLNEKPVNYKEEHYTNLMKGKVKTEDMNKVINDNLEMMDKLLELRKIEVTELAATKSVDAMIAYFNQSEYGHWLIGYFAHLNSADKKTARKGINEVLPYVANRDNFISNIKFSMKENRCKTLAFDCLINDLMAMNEADCILSDDGYDTLRLKYKKDLDDFLTEMKRQHDEEMTDDGTTIEEYNLHQAVRTEETHEIFIDDKEKVPF